MQFAWRWQAFGDGDRQLECESASPTVESVAIELALVAVEQRLQDNDASMERARLLIDTTASMHVLLNEPPERPPGPTITRAVNDERRERRRAPAMLNAARWRAIERALAAQHQARLAVSTAAESSGAAAAVAAHFFTSARLFRQALELTPTTTPLRRSASRVSALAYRWSAEAVVDSGQHENGGVAVALARQAEAVDPSNDRVREFARDMERRNELEFGMQSVPEQLRVVFAAGTEPAVNVDEEDGVVIHVVVA